MVADISDNKRQGEADLIRGNMGLRVEGKRGRDRPELTWKHIVRTDMATYGTDGAIVEGTRAWEATIH